MLDARFSHLIFLSKLTHAAARFACDSWPTCHYWRRQLTLTVSESLLLLLLLLLIMMMNN